MDERSRALAEFDRQHGVPSRVSLTAVDIGFWNLVNLVLKVYVAILVASAIIGAFVGIGFAIFLILFDGAG